MKLTKITIDRFDEYSTSTLFCINRAFVKGFFTVIWAYNYCGNDGQLIFPVEYGSKSHELNHLIKILHNNPLCEHSFFPPIFWSCTTKKVYTREKSCANTAFFRALFRLHNKNSAKVRTLVVPKTFCTVIKTFAQWLLCASRHLGNFYANERRECVTILWGASIYRGGFLPGVSSSKVAVGHFLLYVVLKNELEKSYAPFKSLYQGSCARIFDVDKNIIYSNGFMKIDFD